MHSCNCLLISFSNTYPACPLHWQMPFHKRSHTISHLRFISYICFPSSLIYQSFIQPKKSILGLKDPGLFLGVFPRHGSCTWADTKIIIIKFTIREGIHKRQSLYRVSATKRNNCKTMSHHTKDYIALMNYIATQTDKNYKLDVQKRY